MLFVGACTPGDMASKNRNIESAGPDIGSGGGAPWPALQAPWNCAANIPMSISGAIVETGTDSFVMRALRRNIKVGLENLGEFRAIDLRVGDEVSVSGTTTHGAFAQPGLTTRSIFVKRLGALSGSNPYFNRADGVPVYPATTCDDINH